MASWSSDQRQRLTAESRILRKYFPSVRWINPDDPDSVRVEIELRTNSGERYLFWVVVPFDYPSSQPHLLVADPFPLDSHGWDLLATNGAMHTLCPLNDYRDYVRICHYRGWDPNKTIYLAVAKGRLWLEAYEQHLDTHMPIDRYLKHM